MNIILTPESEQYLLEQLAAGKFPSADAAVSEALVHMRDFERKMDELWRDIAVGIHQADQGLATEFNEAAIDRIKSKARQASS